MPRIDIATVPKRQGTGYPAPFDAPCAERIRQRLGNAGGITDFGINLMRLPPGNWSSQRHWHSHEDEFVYVLEGSRMMARRCCAPATARPFRRTRATAIT
jgi:uncharacterized cupin superfamily protein